MGSIQKIIYFILFLIPTPSLSQDCGLLVKSVDGFKSKYYFLDSNNIKFDFLVYSKEFKPADTSLVRTIIEKGKISDGFKSIEDFNYKSNFSITKISMEKFLSLPNDTIIFSNEEKREIKKIKKKIDKYNLPTTSEKSREKIAKYLNREYSIKLQKKMWAVNPILIIMYPSFNYQNYKLTMCHIINRSREGIFLYELCLK